MASETLPSLESSGVKRALLIGINTYKKGSQLQYCINNAQNCGTKLRDVGFHVTIGIDMNYEEMCTMIEDWVCKICPGDQALAFFSGHGTHFDDQNFLIPVDNDQLTSPTMFELRSINVHATLEKMMARHPSAAIFLLDCCFSYVIPNEAASKGVFDCGGLSSMIEVDDSLVVFACDANKTIPDRSTNNQNSIFTAHLLEHIAKPNLTIEEIMNLVCSGVMNETNGDQCPYQASSLYRRKIDLNHRNDTDMSTSVASANSITAPQQSSTQIAHYRQILEQLCSSDNFRDDVISNNDESCLVRGDDYFPLYFDHCVSAGYDFNGIRIMRGNYRYYVIDHARYCLNIVRTYQHRDIYYYIDIEDINTTFRRFRILGVLQRNFNDDANYDKVAALAAYEQLTRDESRQE
ncbi:unnamed protein product [Rotaria socialis]|nr:unnamed protein product [Rotaria socialis]CAF4367740.1 unnamed protein product [Rotaria socialis]CAF4475205.1 unnamed protein product [Rotaria socialis]CAF4736088.1 unnamed protein product [Rotaria socialis]CAF4845843.1 unnamed protein product [Rotaria socialis]